MTYAVLTNTLGGFEDCWTVTDSQGKTMPDRYESIEQAQAEIDDIFDEYARQVKEGEREVDEMPDKESEYIIVHVSEIGKHCAPQNIKENGE